MIVSLLLLFSAVERVVLVDELIRVPPSQWHAVDFALNQRPATIECKFSVERGPSGVRVALLDRRELRRFRGREPHRVILSTGFQKSGGFRYSAGIGEYSLVIDNRLEGRGPAEVRLEVALSFGGRAQPHVQELSTRRRVIVILLSLLFFSAIAFPAARRLRRAFRSGSAGLLLLITCAFTALPASARADPAACPEIVRRGGWVIETCASDPKVTAQMEIVVDGVSWGNATLLRIYHQSQDWPGAPQVAVLYASGFVRLKQNADPSPAIPFGSSFILGPAYWAGPSTYYHNPQLTRLEIDTQWLGNGPLRLRAEGRNHDFQVAYQMALPPPRDRQTRLHVIQTCTATADIAVSPERRAEFQGFKLVQVSSMFINDTGACSGGSAGCHDSNAARYIGVDLARRQTVSSSVTPPGFVFSAPPPLGNSWLDVLHTDDQGWQGNTPNLRIALDALPVDYTVTPQGWITATTDPNDDNVNLWLHDDGPASQSWRAGESHQVSYWLLAQDSPPDPWADNGLRPGLTFLDFEGSERCAPVLPGPAVTGSLAGIGGHTDIALELRYNLGSAKGNWTQIRCDFEPPLDLSRHDHLRFEWRGDPAAANSLQVGLVTREGSRELIFARGYNHATHRAWWGRLVIPFRFLQPWTEGTTFDPSRVSAFFLSVVEDTDDAGGAGSIALDNVGAYNAGARPVPGAFEMAAGNRTASAAAAKWLAGQQRASGLLKSWEEEPACVAHTYDQALALIVLAREGLSSEADALVRALAATQNEDGSWFKSRDCETLSPVHVDKWEGDIAWAVFALTRYINFGGADPQALMARNRAADWLITRLHRASGCLALDHTEGAIDTWWALQAAGPPYTESAERLKSCLIEYYWDEPMGRFKGGKSWWQLYLDNQTWGAAFLTAIGEEERARRALSYALGVLRTPAQSGQLAGFDGQGGPWSVWNEGAGQYAAVGGEGANDLLVELLAQQRSDGAVPASPDDFNGAGVWITRWHGVAPTAWLYNALNGEPFRLNSPT